MHSLRLAALVAALALFALCGTALATARPVAPEDLFKLHFVSSPQISHDGKLVTYVVSREDGPKNTMFSNIWIGEVATGRTWQLTRGDSDRNPQWSPNDRWIAFSSGRSEKSQIYRISLSGGEAERLTDLPNGADSAQWSHDGARILFEASTKAPVRDALVDWKLAGFSPGDEQKKTDVRTIDVLHFRTNGDGEDFMYHQHIWVMHADGSAQTALTSGTQWSEGGELWSPDDQAILFNSYRAFDPANFRQDLYVMPADGGAMRKLSISTPSNFTAAWSNSDKRIWYAASSAPDPASYPAIVSANSDGSAAHTIVAENSVAIGDATLTDTEEGGAGCGPLLDLHGAWFLADVSVPGGSALEKFDASTGKMQTLIDRGDEITACSMSDDGSRVAFTETDATHPVEVYVANTTGGEPKQLSFANKDWLQTVDLSPVEPFSVKDSAGFLVRAWIIHPPHAIAGRRYPTLLEIHGGPETEFGNAFFHEMQFLAGQGYNVVFADPRGSVGFGYAFEQALEHNWGDPMFQDEMAVMDAASNRPEVDANRLGVLGGSYGGYSTLWVIGHTHRFKVAVGERAVSNMTSEFLASDFPSKVSAQYSFGDAWDHQAAYWRMSPLAYVANVTTPVLIIHSDQDIRTPIDQAVQEYSALKILGRTTEFVEFPRENHDLSRTGEPIHRVERLHIIANWLNRYLRP